MYALLGAGQTFVGKPRWGFSLADGVLYMGIVDYRLQDGFIHQLGERVVQRLGLPLCFVETPNRRVGGFVANGYIYMICNSDPGWDSRLERYHQSPTPLEEQDVLLQHDGRPAIRDFTELCGKTLGTSLGYAYADNPMQASATGEIRREDTHDLASRAQILKRSHLDTMVNMRHPLFYLTRQHSELDLSVSPLILQSYWTYCTYGGQLPIPIESMNQVLDEMVGNGSIERLLENSLRTPQKP